MPTRNSRIWDGRTSDVHDAPFQAAYDGANGSQAMLHRSKSSISVHTTSTNDSTDEKTDRSDSIARRVNCRRFPFSSGSLEMKAPYPPSPPSPENGSGLVNTIFKKGSIFPLGWLFGTMVKDFYNAISRWILEKISTWLLQRSLLGSVRNQVFRDLKHRMKSGPASVLVLPPPIDELGIKKSRTNLSERDSRKSKVVKMLEERESDLMLVGGSGAVGMAAAMGAQELPVADDDGASQTVQWVIFAIEVMALIPIVVIGLSLFYILAVGIYNDVQDLLRRLFGDRESDGGDNKEEPANETSSADLHDSFEM